MKHVPTQQILQLSHTGELQCDEVVRSDMKTEVQHQCVILESCMVREEETQSVTVCFVKLRVILVDSLASLSTNVRVGTWTCFSERWYEEDCDERGYIWDVSVTTTTTAEFEALTTDVEANIKLSQQGQCTIGVKRDQERSPLGSRRNCFLKSLQCLIARSMTCWSGWRSKYWKSFVMVSGWRKLVKSLIRVRNSNKKEGIVTLTTEIKTKLTRQDEARHAKMKSMKNDITETYSSFEGDEEETTRIVQSCSESTSEYDSDWGWWIAGPSSWGAVIVFGMHLFGFTSSTQKRLKNDAVALS